MSGMSIIKNLVSVIIPSYGGSKILNRCINSVLEQTYKNIEIIVVDDNGIGTPSQLETAKVMSYYKCNKQIKYICHSVNINGAAARNTGIKNSLGEYIAFLDDDDVFLKEKIEKQVNLLSSLPSEYGAVYCSHETFLRGEKIGEEHAVLDGFFLYEYMLHKVEIASSSILIRRSVLEEINGFDESFKRHQDWEFISRLLNKYAIKSDDFYGFEKNLIFRNSMVSPQIFKERRLYYLNKMYPIIANFTKEEQNLLLVQEYFDIAISFIKAKDYIGFIKEICLIKPKLLLIKVCFRRIISFAKHGFKIIK